MKHVRFLALLLVIIGALNWGCVGFFGVDVVSHLLGGAKHTLARIVFGLVGLAGLYSISLLSCGCKCGPGCSCRKK